ncbi:MAG TPA: helix-turn-helix domain-containing protein [Longimicrobium sp.]|nr:helix-turn-helix domain-containing protein [Longimicrobium sp.]
MRRVGTRGFHCTFLSNWDRLRQAVVNSPPAAILIVDPYVGTGERPSLSPELRTLLWEFPSATVLAALEIRPGRSRDLRTLGEWGVTDIISLAEEDTQEAVYRRLRSVEGRSLQGLLDRTLPQNLSGRGRMLLMTAAEVVSVGGKGRDLARRLHLSERTVLRWCERSGLPAPRRLLAWMRILLAASLLDDPGRTVLSVAGACGYSSDSSLRRALQDFLGIGPSALRREGAFPRAAGGFLEDLARSRGLARDRQPFRL